jgi:shikimate kinase
MKKQQLVAEIIGPAGAGKSTLSRLLDGRDRAMRTGVSVWGMPLHLLGIHLLLLLPTFVSLSRSCRWLRWDEIKQLVRLNALNQLLDRESSKDYQTILLNEGAVFTLAKLGAFGQGSSPSLWSEKWSQGVFNQWATTLDAIIWLDAPDQVLAQRIRAREKPHRMKESTDQEIYEFLARYRSSYERVVSALRTYHGPKVIRVSTDQESPDQIADKVLAGLRGDWRAGRRVPELSTEDQVNKPRQRRSWMVV